MRSDSHHRRSCASTGRRTLGRAGSALSDGLPTDPYYASILRDAMVADSADPTGIYFGTRLGEVYASRDEGDSWSMIAGHLPDVLSVRVAEIA